MPSAAPQAWSHERCTRAFQAALLSCALALGACSVYTGDLVDADALTGQDGGNGQGGSLKGPSGSSGKSTSGGGGKSSVGMVGGTSGTTGGDGETGGTGSTGGDGAGSAGTSTAEAGSANGGNPGGTGGTGSSAGSGGGGSPPVTGPGDLLDGFEDEDLTLEQSAGRGGVWYLFNDGTVGKAGPAPLACSPLVEAPAGLGSYAMHITATGFTSWGSGLGVDFRAGKKVYDGSTHSGFRFWARVGAGKNTRHRVQLADGTTDILGGKCNAAANAPDGEKCEDHFGINQTFTTTWTQYVVPFSALSQIGWGNAAAALDKTTLYGLQVTAKAKLEVDLWLDQIEFF